MSITAWPSWYLVPLAGLLVVHWCGLFPRRRLGTQSVGGQGEQGSVSGTHMGGFMSTGSCWRSRRPDEAVSTVLLQAGDVAGPQMHEAPGPLGQQAVDGLPQRIDLWERDVSFSVNYRRKGQKENTASATVGPKGRRHLDDVLHIKVRIKGQLHVPFRQQRLQGAGVPPQATEGAGVAGPLCVGAKEGRTEGNRLCGNVARGEGSL